MKKFILILLLAIFVMPVKANEGMWFLMHIERLNYTDMQKMGLQLTPEEIYSVNNSSLKDAIVQFGGGCTAEIISKNGLVLTNHHCGYGNIAQLSSEKNDYLTNGFWAKNHAEELKPENLSVRFFVRMDDVSERILSLVNDNMSELERERVVNQEIAKIEKENNEGGKYTVSVKSFYSGNEYYYFVYQDYTDVRLVGTPPNSIGKFGGDTDNWEWPRHTGDFALFRVYGDKDGNPAEYSASNVPLQPKYHLPVSVKGFEEDDFAMILGYPGRTNRWMPSAGIEQNVKYAYPAWVEASKTAMDAMKKHMDANQQVRLDYASSYASIANYWKNREGMIEALTQHKTAEEKLKKEDEFLDFLTSDKNKTGIDPSIMEDINTFYYKTNEKSYQHNYLFGFLRSSKLTLVPNRLAKEFKNYAAIEKKKDRKKALPAFKEEIEKNFKGLHLPLEKDVMLAQLNLYIMKGVVRLDVLKDKWGDVKDGKYSIEQYVDEIFENSIFISEKKQKEFFKNPSAEAVDNDILTKLSAELLTRYRYQSEEDKKLEEAYQKAYRKMIKGMRAMNPDTKYYPDANSTLRLSYGKVRALPEDMRNDATANYFTTLKGTIAKYQPGDEEFDMPKKLIDLYNTKNYGIYADKAGHLPVNFLTDNDITGGNSGSPVLNGKGELIGLAFDGNIEAMAGDVIFDHDLQRTINVDIRYILFLIDKYAEAPHLVEEMTIVK